MFGKVCQTTIGDNTGKGLFAPNFNTLNHCPFGYNYPSQEGFRTLQITGIFLFNLRGNTGGNKQTLFHGSPHTFQVCNFNIPNEAIKESFCDLPSICQTKYCPVIKRQKDGLSQLNYDYNKTLYLYKNSEMEDRQMTITLHVHVEGKLTEIEKLSGWKLEESWKGK